MSKTYFHFFLYLLFFGCTKSADPKSSEIFSLHTNDLLTSIHIDNNGNFNILGGYVWSHCLLFEGKNPSLLKGDTLSNKLLFDFQESADGTQFCVGVDGYLYSRTSENWNFHRLTRWDILHQVIPYPDGSVIASGGKSYEHGYIYFINKELKIDTSLYFDFEISEMTVNASTMIAVGYGNIIRSVDHGQTWKFLGINGDFFASIIFTDSLNILAIGYNGTILKSPDKGITWQNISDKVPAAGINSFRKIRQFDNGDIIIIGNKGKLWQSKDKGTSWSYFSLDTKSDLYSIAEHQNKYYVVGTNGFFGAFSF
ncbi:MAG: hypothetical protein IPM42_03625 [Saprospiraceae bacterium]|nr:hypothetical protein [Saprospiraceae bacterium]